MQLAAYNSNYYCAFLFPLLQGGYNSKKKRVYHVFLNSTHETFLNHLYHFLGTLMSTAEPKAKNVEDFISAILSDSEYP